jgi:hypothetical protein
MLNKYLKNVGLKGRQIISLPGVPTCLGLVLAVPKGLSRLANQRDYALSC